MPTWPLATPDLTFYSSPSYPPWPGHIHFYLFCHLCWLAVTRRTQISPVGAWIPPKGFVFT